LQAISKRKMIKNNSIKKAIQLLLAIIIGGGIIWLSVRKLSSDEWAEIKTSFREANYWWIALSITLGFMSNVFRSIRWQMLLKPMGYQPRFINIMLSVLVAYFANLGLPRIGEIARCGLLQKHEKVPFEKAMGTVITERALDLIVFASLFILNFILQYKQIHTYVEKEIFSNFEFSLSGTLVFLAIGMAVIVIIFLAFRKRFSQHKFYQKLVDLLKGLFSGIKSISKVDKPFLFVLHTFLIWFCYWLMTYLTLQALPVTSGLSGMVALSALMIGTIGIILVQGGLGVYPLLIAGTLLAYGINYASGYAMGWLLWSGQTMGIIVGGITALILITSINKKANP
jgi:uncharacterized protein (TIRG00374 family)